ncbi:ATP-grasp domain-containing protein [Neobacillus sp. NPDC093182]|uniref:ATP-grasp domain-containing protein n=1 Tax=Neobacillus sp. NPDC093182 TaxID=3364297 RepID=UPI0037F9EF2B
MQENMINILFTSSGRRVSLIKKFKETLSEKKLTGKIITVDFKGTAPSAFFSDKHYLVPRVMEKNYLNELIRICQLEKIKLVIPLIDTELELLSNNRKLFDDIGVDLLVSSCILNEITSNKTKTYKFFLENSISSPKVYSEIELSKKEYNFPVIIKPTNGSSSEGVIKINNQKELEFFIDYIPDAMVQEYVNGDEYTVDVMLDFKGNIKTIVPRKRLETRSGEVSKGVTKKDFHIISEVEKVVKKLPGAIGCITLQCFKKMDGEITFIEINPRFGGGIPLSIEAGANFPLWIIEMCLGNSFKEHDFSWKENLTMLRFDEAIFTESISYEDKCISV